MPNDATVISFELDFGNSIESFNSLVTAGDKLNKTISDIKKTASSVLPETGAQFDDATQNINDTLNSMAKVNDQIKSGKLDSYQVSVKTDEFNNLAKSLSAIIADMQTVQKLTASIGKQTSAYTQKQMKTLMPQLMSMARDATRVYAQSGSLASDEQILASIKATQKYQAMKSSLLGNSKSGNIDDIFRLAIVRGVGQTQRASFMNRIATGSGLTKHIFDSFQNMLPSGFKNINSSLGNISTTAFSKALQSNQQTLSAKETKALYSLLLNNQFATEAAEAAKIAYRKNGELFVQKNVSRGMIKSMGAHIYDNLVNAAKGMEMYGITDVNDPAFWDKISRKSNKRLIGNVAAARRLSDAFEWFEAERYSQNDYNKLVNGKRTMYSAGKINFSPTPNSYEVAMYTLDDLQKKRNWNDRKTYSNYKDYHHIAVDESMHLNTIMRNSKSGIKKHNAYTDDVLYLEIDPRLGDPNLSQAERGALINQYADVFQHGISGKGKNSSNERYVLSRINPKMGAEFVRKSIYDKINKEDPTYFSAGLNQTEFTDWKTFAGSMEYRNKNATPGKSIQKLFGSDLPKNIVVVDLEDTTKGNGGAGLNGASIISNKIVQKGFQGRAHGIKTALTSADIDTLVDTYGDQLYLTAFTGNEAEKGKRIKINKGVDMIVNAADLKNASTRFAGMTNEEITKVVQKDIQKGIYANRLYSDANGKTSWISGQLAQTLSMDKDASMMFARSFMDHYRNVGNYNYAMQYLFNEGETHDLLEKHPELFGSKLVQNRISDYRQAIMARMLRGDIMLPNDVNAYKGMAAPWLIDAFNADMQTKHANEKDSVFSQLPEDIQNRLNSLTLGENRVLFQKTLATKLGLGRYPATGQSMQAVMNANTDKNISKFAESIGLDPYGLYISTTSPLMQLLQDADFDGDVMEIIELATNEKKKASVAKVMDKIVTATVKNNKKLYESGKITEEELKQRDEVLKRERFHGNSFSTDFSTAKGAKSAAVWLSDYALQSSSMGMPNATVRNAFQMTPDSEIAMALIDADKQYSANSVEGKKGKGRNTSSEQLSVVGKYKPFSEWYRMVDKSRDEFGNINPEELRKRNFFGVNLPSASMSGSMRSQNLARFIAKNFYGYDINDGYNWDEILQIAHGDIDPNSAVGRMKLALKDTMLGIVNADYLAPSDVMVAQLLQLKARAQEEEEKRIASERAQGLLKGKDINRTNSSIAQSRLSSQGGNVIDNLVSYALTQNSSIVSGNRDMFGQLNQLGIRNLIGHKDFSQYIAGEVMSSEALKQEAEAKRMLARNDVLSQISTFDENTRKRKIDQLIFSPSLLSSLIKNPTAWAAHYLGGEEQDVTPYTHLGWATHESVEGFMRKRLAKATQDNPAQMTSEELTQAAQEAVADFEKYFDENVGKKGLSKTDVKKLKTTNAYKGIKDYLSSNLIKLFPEEDYEVVAIEGATSPSEKNSSLSFDLGKKINKNENGEEENVESRGYFDLLVRNRKTGKYAMGDLKNYPHATAHDRAMWKMQQLLYASALPGFLSSKSLAAGELEGLHIVEPIYNKISQINSSPEAIQDNLKKAQEGTRLIQTLAENGFQMDQILSVSKALDDMFGHSGFSSIANALQEEQNRSEHIQSQMGSSSGEGVGAALVMHDEYNKAMQSLSGINNFIWKNDPNKQNIHGNMWHRNYEQLAMQQGIVYDLENSKMDIQADMLRDQIDRTRLSLDTLLPAAAVQNLQEAYDLLKGINSEEIASKKANSKVEEFKNLTRQIEMASDAYDVLKDKIDANKSELKQKKAALKTTDDEAVKTQINNEIAEIENQNEIYAESAKKASALKSKLNGERKRYLAKNETDTWNELTQRQESLRLLSSGERSSNVTSIVDQMSSYIKSVNQLKADAKLYAKEFGIDQTSEAYTNYMQGLDDLVSVSSMTKYRNKVIEDSFVDFLSRRGQIAGNVNGMRLTTDEQIENAVRLQTEKIKHEKENIENRYKGSNLTKQQKEEKQKLLDYYNTYNEDEYRNQLRADREIAKQREDLHLSQMLRQGDQMQRHMYGRRGNFITKALDQRDAGLSQWENRKQAIDEKIKEKNELLQTLKAKGKGQGDTEYDKAAKDLTDLSAASESAGKAIEQLSDPMSTAMVITNQFGEVVGRLAQRLGRQLFHKALAEAKRFVKEFNQQMTTIQMITLKSDSEMSKIGDGLINKAKELKVSVSEISQSAATLYRQGLSDEEVNERLDVISKFSKVSGTKVDAATKLITVAMNTGLVSNPEIASDIVTALGDNAATNAAEIEKGIEKAGAAAAADGTTFAELASMLTAITSTTQIGGNVAGRTLNTIFGRMNKIGTNELISDENGNLISGSAVAQLLEAQGIKMYDENGNKRSSFDTLYALSQRWEKMSDAEQQQIANAIAGTRQYSNFSAIMQGMAEGKVDEYMELAGESSGITNKKYDVYTQSLQASLTDLQNTFDKLVADLVDKGYVQDFIGGITTMIQGVDNLAASFGGLQAALPAIIALLGAFAGVKFGGLTGALVGATLGLGAYGILSYAGQGNEAKERNEEFEKDYSAIAKKYDGVSRLKELRNNNHRTNEENQEYATLINDYAKTLGLANTNADAAAYSIESLSEAISGLSSSADEKADDIIEQINEKDKKDFASSIANKRSDLISEMDYSLEETAREKSEDLSLGNRYLNGEYKPNNPAGYTSWFSSDGGLWYFDEEANEYKLNKNALSNQNYVVNKGKANDSWFGLMGLYNKARGGSDISFNRDLEDSLVSFYHNASSAGAMGDHERNTTREDWKKRIRNGVITQEWLEAAFNYMDRSGSKESVIFNSEKDISKDILTRKLGNRYDANQIDYLADKMANVWYETGSSTEAFNSIFGTDSSYDAITSSINRALEGYTPTKKPIQIGNYELEDVGVGGYYLDENGNHISRQEALLKAKQYNTTRRNEIAGRKVIGVGDEEGITFQDYSGSEYTEAEAQQLASRNNTYKYFIDDQGNRRYKDSKGNWITNDAELEAAINEYNETEAQHTSSFQYGAKLYEFHGTKAEAERLAEEKRQELAARAFTIRYGNEYTGLTFGSEEEANAYAEMLNRNERIRYQRELAIAEQEQRENSAASYKNIYGETVLRKGMGSAAEIERLRQQELEENPFVLKGQDGTILGTYKTEELAKEALIDYTHYHDVRSGKYLGYGREGYEASQALKEDIEYFANRVSIGKNEAGEKALEDLKDYKYQFTNYNGDILSFADEKSANDAFSVAWEQLETARQLRYNDLVDEYVKGIYDESNRGPVDENGRYKVLWDRVNEEFRNQFETISEGISPYEMPEITTKRTPVQIAKSETASILKAEDVIGSLQKYIPELANIDPAKIAAVYGRLPTEVQTLIDHVAETGEATTEIIETIDESLSNLVAPKLKAVYNRFNEAAGTSYQAWKDDKKNNLALLADEAARAVMGSGALNEADPNKAIQVLADYVNFNDNLQWESLVRNSPEFGRILDQIKLDESGIVTSAPSDILDQITLWLYKNGKDYGELQIPVSQKARAAQTAFNGLLNEGWYTSYEARNSALQSEYDKNVTIPWQEAYDEYVKSLPENMPQNIREDVVAQYKKAYRQQTIDEYAVGKFNDKHYLSDLDQAYLSEILGADLATRIKGNLATQEELDLASLKLNNAQFGLTELTARDKLRGIQAIRSSGKTIGDNEGQFRTSVAAQYLQGWGGFNDYVALTQAKETNEELFKQMGGQEYLDILTASLDEFQKAAQLKVDIEGIEQLEEAGKIASGTAEAIEKLRKGGKIALDVEMKLRSQAYESGQQRAKLINGTSLEQDEAAMAILNMSSEEYYAHRNQNYQEALRIDETYNRAIDAETLATEYKEAKGDKEKRWVLERAALAGWKPGREFGTFEYIGTDINRTSSFAGQTQKYTEAALAAARIAMINEEDVGSELAEAASSGMGFYGSEYLRQLADENITPTEELKQLALQEAQLAKQQADEANALELARIGSGTLGGMFSYQQTQREQNNKAANVANSLFASITSDKVQSFKDLMDTVNGDSADDWKTLIESSGDLSQKLTDIGVKATEDGGLDFSEVESRGIELADVLQLLAGAASNAATSLQGIAEPETTGEKFEKAMDFANGKAVVDEDEAYAALREVYGNDALAQTVAYNRRTIYAKAENLEDRDGFFIDENGDKYESREAYIAANYNKFAGLSEYNRQYAEQLEQNAQYGISGLTDMQRLEQLQKIIDAAQNGGLADLRNDDKIGQFADVTSGIEGFEKWERAVEAIQAADLNLSDFNEDSEQFKNAIESTGISVKDFADINEDMTENIKAKTISALKLYGKESEKVAATYKKLTGTTEEQLEAEQQMTKNRLSLANSTYYTSGAGSKDFRKVAKDFLGYSKEELAALEKEQGQEGAKLEIQRQANLKLEVDQQQVINDANAVIQSTLDSIPDVNYDDIIARVGGTYDISALSEMAANLEGDAKAVIDALIQSLSNIEGKVTITGEADANGNTATISVKGSGLTTKGGGHRTGGGGGGGGKSELDKLLERQKNQIAEIEHNNKILQILYEGLDFVNDYGGMSSNIDQQIASQERLRSAYASNIAQLQDQLAGVEEGSDDWYKLTDAIRSAEEAMLSVNNTINQLRGAKITILEQKQEYESGPKNHKGSILDKRAQRYQITGQFNAYNETVQQSITNTKEQINQNNRQIGEWENLLSQTIKGSDDWYKIREKIWQKKEENEQLYNDVVQAQIDLEKARIDQIAKELELETMNDQHANNMLSTFAQMYESVYDYKDYQKAIQDQSNNLEKIKDQNAKAIENIKTQIAGMAEDDPAREYAIQMLHQLEEQNAQIQSELLQNQQALEESYMNEIEHRYQERRSNVEHESKLLDEEYKKYQRNQDYLNQENILSEQARNKQDDLRLQERELEDLQNLMASGKITEGSKQWFDLQDLIRSITESIAELNNEITETQDRIAETRFENIINRFQEGTEDTIGMDQLQHERNLIGYQKTKYQNRGELTNVGRMLEFDRERITKQRDNTANQIKVLRAFKDTVKNIPDLYDKVTDEIKKQEEELAKYTNALEQTNDAIEKNQEAIRQARIKMENEADKAIRSIIQKQRNMLSATVSIQNTILDNIRNYYKEQWDLQKKTIDKEKQALNDEKNLLTEQLNFKKKMMDQESKEEELAEYKRQLALISADTTRTKDANELRRKISEMEKDMAIQTAQDIANAETKSIDDRIKGWDNYVSVQEEDLNNMLSNANNFRELIDQLMSGSFEDFVAWNATINKNYKNATDEQRKQMEQGWDDTWLNMLGMLRTYWDEVDEASRSREGFLSLLMSTDDYNSRSETGRESYLYNMGEIYDNFTNSLIDNAEFSDTHELLNTVNELKDWTFTVKLSNPQDLNIDTLISNIRATTNKTGADKVNDDLYSGWGVDYVAPAPVVTQTTSSGDSGGGGSGTSKTKETTPTYRSYIVYGYSPQHKHQQYGVSYDTLSAANNAITKGLQNGWTGLYVVESSTGKKVGGALGIVQKFAGGGLVDFTGPAWVDGTKSRPESFLDATDTALLRSMLDTFTYVKTSPYITHLDQSNFSRGGVNIGDVNVNLYEAKLENDADYDLIAQKVGNAFTKQLQKDGFNLAGYAW